METQKSISGIRKANDSTAPFSGNSFLVNLFAIEVSGLPERSDVVKDSFATPVRSCAAPYSDFDGAVFISLI
jgi:hypothetical protein